MPKTLEDIPIELHFCVCRYLDVHDRARLRLTNRSSLYKDRYFKGDLRKYVTKCKSSIDRLVEVVYSPSLWWNWVREFTYKDVPLKEFDTITKSIVFTNPVLTYLKKNLQLKIASSFSKHTLDYIWAEFPEVIFHVKRNDSTNFAPRCQLWVLFFIISIILESSKKHITDNERFKRACVLDKYFDHLAYCYCCPSRKSVLWSVVKDVIQYVELEKEVRV